MDTLTHNETMSIDDNHDGYLEENDHIENLSALEEFRELDPKDDEMVPMTKEMWLIKLIEEEPALYNPRHIQYRNAEHKEAIWQKVSKMLGWSEAQTKTKWKALRDQFCRELKRIRYSPKATIKWKYFKYLEFLRPYALNRNYRPRFNQVRPEKELGENSNEIPVTSSGDPCFSDGMNIKIESTQLNECSFSNTDLDGDHGDGILTISNDQLSTVNWSNYLAVTSTVDTDTQMDNEDSEQSLLSQEHHQHQEHDSSDYIYDPFANCLNSNELQDDIQEQHNSQQLALNCVTSSPLETASPTSQSHLQNNLKSEDEANMFHHSEAYCEKELIAIVKREALSCSLNQSNCRNLKIRKEVWMEISNKIKKTDKQCRQKWKALREQFIREHKRLKDETNIKYIPRWKHYDALLFLKSFIRTKNDTFSSNSNQNMKSSDHEESMEEHIGNDSSMEDIKPLQHELHGFNSADSISPVTNSTPISKTNQTLQQSLDGTPIRITTTSPTGTTTTTNLCVGNNFGALGIQTYIISEDNTEPFTNETQNNNENKGCDGNNCNDSSNSQHEKSFQTNISTDVNPLTVLQSHSNQSNKIIYNLTNGQDLHDIKIIHANNSNVNAKTYLNSNHGTQLKLIDSKNSLYAACATTSAAASISPATVKIIPLPKKTQLQMVKEPSPLINQSTISSSLVNTAVSLPKEASSINHVQQIVSSASLVNQDNLQSSKTQVSSSPTTSMNSFKDDDEVGAFFKAVAMKIRNANMSPNSFTNLQIDILRLINDSINRC